MGKVLEAIDAAIINAQEKLYTQVGRDLFSFVTGIESITEVVMFHITGGSDCIVSAVVIGKDQSFRTHDLTGTATTKDDDRIFQRCFVDIIELVFGEFEAFFHHIVINLLS